MSTLYVIATPIGNLEDISPRALRILKSVNTIFCEDTRVSMKLLQHYDIKGARLISCNDHNEAERIKTLIKTLDSGEDLALISDAGTPVISDPGSKLLEAIYDPNNDEGDTKDQQHQIVSIPGASSLTAALSICPIDSSRFVFEGFLPHGPKQRRRVLRRLQEERAAGYGRTLVFFESPHRIFKTLTDIETIFGTEIKIFIARELSKKFEQNYYGSVSEVLQKLKDQFPNEVQGELVLVLE